MLQAKHRNVVWASLILARSSVDEVHKFLQQQGYTKGQLKRDMHITIYHARRKLPGLSDQRESVEIEIPTSLTRMMVLAPGGEQVRADLDQGKAPIGIRVQRAGRSDLNVLRERMISH